MFVWHTSKGRDRNHRPEILMVAEQKSTLHRRSKIDEGLFRSCCHTVVGQYYRWFIFLGFD